MGQTEAIPWLAAFSASKDEMFGLHAFKALS
jgi:hypothetical protein